MSIYKNGKLIAGGSQALPLLSFMWADHILNHPSWLRADTFSWQAGNVYTAVYQHLVADIDGVTAESETVGGVTISFYRATDGHKITTDESAVLSIYNATGVAWYYILDTANTRFKLPRTKFGFTGLRDGVGGYVEAGLPNITGTIQIAGDLRGTPTGAFATSDNGGLPGAQNTGSDGAYTRFSAADSNAIYGNSDTVQPRATQQYLYFYVGQFTKTALENTAGINTELFNEKADITAIPDLITPDYDNATTITNGTIYLADKTYLAILGCGSGSQAHVDVSKNSDMSNPITIVQIYITSSGNIYFVSTGIIPKGWYYKATNGATKIVPIG